MSSECESLLGEDMGPLGLNYLHIYYCEMKGYEAFTLLLFFSLTALLIYLLGQTADTYFSPTLGSICEKLKIPYQVAGVTFLAMGNGSPDVFASITSFTGGQDALIGIGALLGASMFVVTVVVGIVTILSPCQVDASVFTRDISFHILSVTIFTYAAITRTINIITVGSFFLLYAIYVTIVIISWWRSKSTPGHESGSGSNSGTIQAAYWHASSRQKETSQNRLRGAEKKETPAENTGYTFLILGEPKFTTRNGLVIPNYEEEDDEELGNDDEDGEGEVTINLSGGLITPHFDHELLEDYFNPTSSESKENSLPKASKPTLMAFDGVEGPEHSSQSNSKQSSLLPSFLNPAKSKGYQPISSNDRENLHAPLLGESTHQNERQPQQRSKSRSNVSANSMVISQLYWHQIQLRRRMHHHILNAEWWSYPFYLKIFSLLEYPLIFARDITIPTVDSELWFKPYAILQPLASPFLILYATGSWDTSVNGIPSPWIGLMIGGPISLYIFLTTHYSHPPEKGIYSILWVLMAFVMCIIWIYLLANELVICLQSIGRISGIPPPVLGLTILAWGNSVGDLFANMAVAKGGHGEMAIAGCYGGPVFNLCIGLGISFGYTVMMIISDENETTDKDRWVGVEMKIDMSSVISLVFLYIALGSTVIFTVWNRFEMTSVLGYYLLGLYGVYSIAQLIHVIIG